MVNWYECGGFVYLNMSRAQSDYWKLLEIKISYISLCGSLLVSCLCFVDTHIGGIGGEFSEIPDTEAGADNSTTSDYAANTLHIKLV